MNFLADESVDHPIVVRLRDDGHDVVAVAEVAPTIPDATVLAQANQRGDLLLTADKDFGGDSVSPTTGDSGRRAHSLGGIVPRGESASCFRGGPGA